MRAPVAKVSGSGAAEITWLMFDVPEPCDFPVGCETLFVAGESDVGVELELLPLNRMLEIVANTAMRIAGNMNCSIVWEIDGTSPSRQLLRSEARCRCVCSHNNEVNGNSILVR